MRIFTLLMAAMLSLSAGAQNATIHKCGFDLLMEQTDRTHPGYRAAVQATFDEAKRKSTNIHRRGGAEVYTIPVVVHVVWKDSTENLTDSLIESQIAVLNEDFRRLNADAVNSRSLFDDVVGDPMIEFDLIDIVRVATDADFTMSLTGLTDEVKSTDQGGSDPWDTDSYLNIWVCHIQPLALGPIQLGQILGYAYPPAGLDNWPEGASAPSPDVDGVVIDYRVMGRNNPVPVQIPGGTDTLVVRGRTAVHEVGHYLGLRHIWGDGSLLGGSSCGEDDGIDDTPNSGEQASFSCDFTRNTCQDDTLDRPDMIENFMDYSREDCLNSFTNGQISLMRAVLEGPRCGLINNCLSTSSEETLATRPFKVYPNPSSGQLFFDRDAARSNEARIDIMHISGKVVYSGSIPTDLDMTGHPKGVYLIHYSHKQDKQQTKFILQ